MTSMSVDEPSRLAAPRGPRQLQRERRVSMLLRPRDETKHFAGITALLLSGDSRFLFSASRDASIRRWEIREGKGREEEGDDEGTAAATVPSSASAAAAAAASLSPPVSASFSASFAGHGDWVTSLAMPHPRLLASASYDRTVRLWHARAGAEGGDDDNDGDSGDDDDGDGGRRRRSGGAHSSKTDLPPLATLVGHSDYVTCLASLGESSGEEGESSSSAPPRRLASAGLGGEVLIWDLASSSSNSPAKFHLARPPVALPAARASVFSLASDATGSLVAVGGPGGALRVVDARAAGRGEGADLRGHADVVRSLALSACGRRLLSASSDRTVRVWDVGQRRCVCVLAPHTDSAWAVAPWILPAIGGGGDGGERRGEFGGSRRRPSPSPPPSSSSHSWGDDLLSAGRDGVVYRTHAPSRAAEAVAVMPSRPCFFSSSNSSSSTTAAANGTGSFSAPAACSAMEADPARSLVWVAAMGDPSLRAWRVPAARPSAGGGGGGGLGGLGGGGAAAYSSSPLPATTPLSPRGVGGLFLSASVPPLGRAFHVPSSPLVRARQALGGGAGGGGGGGAGGEVPALPPLPPSPLPTAMTASPPPSSLPVIEIPGAEGRPPCVEARWLPDRRRFLARDAAGGVDLWDAALGSRLRTVLPAPPPPPPPFCAASDGAGAGAAAAAKDEPDAGEARMSEAERLCWTPAVGAAWAQLDAALGAPRLTLDKGSAFSSELYSLTDLGQRGAPDDLKVNSGAELLRAAAAGWVRRLAAAEEEEEQEAAGKGAAAEGEEGARVSEAAATASAEGKEEKEGAGKGKDDDDDRAAAAALVSSLRAAEAEAEAAEAAAGGSPPPPPSPPSPSFPSISAFRELEREPSRLLVIAEGGDGAGTPLAVPASRIGAAASAASAPSSSSAAEATFIVDARALLPRWSLDAVLHGPPPPPPASSSSSSSASASASTKMAFVLEPHPRSGGGLPQLAPRRLSAPKVLSLAKVAAHARAKLGEEPHCLELAAEPLACFWDERRQREAERAEAAAEAEAEEEAEEREGESERGAVVGGSSDDGAEATAALPKGSRSRARAAAGARNKPRPPPPPSLELCIGEFAAPLDLSLASARERIWRHAGGNGGNSRGDMVLWYRLVKRGEPRSTRPLLGPE